MQAPKIELVTSNFRRLCTACPCKFPEIELVTRFDVPHNLTNTQKARDTSTATMRKRLEDVTGDGRGDSALSVAHTHTAIAVGRYWGQPHGHEHKLLSSRRPLALQSVLAVASHGQGGKKPC
jgi:hypothetical protein